MALYRSRWWWTSGVNISRRNFLYLIDLYIDFFLQLVRLPRAPTVDKILKKYLDYRIKRDGM
ncbi:hypothetical protein CK203_024831 [Vitis vinifera]|uniref:Uncharacterized protein n=1 Tax=Vitis vinifera TaxID=29760 RepID=A0A438DY65_VITVI|nr:hypothetical protein CK203_092365 [Vitis vinifera]RVX00072.1 hypothetical protein CK203_024831 [Vitis vinifera]